MQKMEEPMTSARPALDPELRDLLDAMPKTPPLNAETLVERRIC